MIMNIKYKHFLGKFFSSSAVFIAATICLTSVALLVCTDPIPVHSPSTTDDDNETVSTKNRFSLNIQERLFNARDSEDFTRVVNTIVTDTRFYNDLPVHLQQDLRSEFFLKIFLSKISVGAKYHYQLSDRVPFPLDDEAELNLAVVDFLFWSKKPLKNMLVSNERFEASHKKEKNNAADVNEDEEDDDETSYGHSGIVVQEIAVKILKFAANVVADPKKPLPNNRHEKIRRKTIANNEEDDDDDGGDRDFEQEEVILFDNLFDRILEFLNHLIFTINNEELRRELFSEDFEHKLFTAFEFCSSSVCVAKLSSFIESWLMKANSFSTKRRDVLHHIDTILGNAKNVKTSKALENYGNLWLFLSTSQPWSTSKNYNSCRVYARLYPLAAQVARHTQASKNIYIKLASPNNYNFPGRAIACAGDKYFGEGSTDTIAKFLNENVVQPAWARSSTLPIVGRVLKSAVSVVGAAVAQLTDTFARLMLMLPGYR